MSTKNVTVTVGGLVVAEAGFINWTEGGDIDYTVAVDTLTDYISVTEAASAHTVTIARGGSLYASAGLSTGATIAVWRANVAGTVTKVYGYRVGGSGATVNAKVNTNDLLSSNLSLTSADTWMDGGAVQNTAVAVGDTLFLVVATVAGSPNEVSVQVELTRTL